MRLIDADALEESIEQIEWYHLAGNGEMVQGATSGNGWYKEQDIYNAIEDAPTIEAKPVVRAHWTYEWDSERDSKRLFVRIVCSNCGLKTGQKSNYCPKCGSAMDKEEEDKESK